jgi:hypothetical protein
LNGDPVPDKSEKNRSNLKNRIPEIAGEVVDKYFVGRAIPRRELVF